MISRSTDITTTINISARKVW